MKQRRQLTLPVQLPETAQFETFVTGENEQLVGFLKQLQSTSESFQQVGIVGAPGSGKTHLLFATLEKLQNRGLQVMFLDLSDPTIASMPSILEGLEQYDLLILDGIDGVVKLDTWCIALFALLNRLIDRQSGVLLWSACFDPQAQNIALADLRSRLESATRFRVHKLSDDYKVQALQKHAQARGLVLSQEVAEYLIHHLQRDMRVLMRVLKQLDSLSMREQRRLTIPFIKNALPEISLNA
ncbi:MAG: DnaA regulatory inactivator Hda [Idiomarinaceae bacterium HL-53]|nr:MAG: DnaA regulatory inactivator Hda [Idiomarinaceae bacterium HL-53]CUS49238.1 regulatory inactivation of DnaA Hda protein [Idiomarinaceae bacterium HL-53]